MAIEIPMGLSERLKNYFHTDLGAFYAHTANRLVLYPFFFSFFLAECFSFWLIFCGPYFVVDYMAFTTMYCLHKAVLMLAFIFGADVLVNRLGSVWGAYNKRTVGRQWMIWSLGMLVGYLLHRIMIRSLILKFAPEAVPYFMEHPEKMLSNTAILMILIPYWVIGVSITLQVVKAKQRIQQQAGSFIVLADGSTSPAVSSNASIANMPKGSLRLEDGNGNIALADITHISVEDHYCRINYSTTKGLKGSMVRLPLKYMTRKLPQDYFIQIHRSHVVNIGHIARLTKTGRDFKVVLKNFGVQLPVSRSRYTDLLPKIGCHEHSRVNIP